MNPQYLAKVMANFEQRGPDACWPWTGQTNARGYGLARLSGETRHRQMAHRTVYELLVGPVPAGLVLDHVCHNIDTTCAGGDDCPHRRCVNPAHLDPVTCGENLARSPHTPQAVKAALTHCQRGHEFTPENTGRKVGRRYCRACDINYKRALRAERRAA